ncbi:G-type lectin S-receptor-like serine/threonine-protein kinase At4g27290 [Populus alba]|uniref:G-type lectin S-receptor-like serine/threonine-protein kinase At4g27290 n=1 Tax=Populus alba TaxID=43335 RepID=UPI003CC762B4
MTRPLQLMLKKDADPWTEKQTQAVKKLKTATQNLPALVIPSTGHHILQTDASDQYWSAVLLEDKDGHQHIYGYKSGSFKESETHYHSTFKEILVVKPFKASADNLVMSFPQAELYKTHTYSLYENPLDNLPELRTLQKTVCLKNNIIPDEVWPKGIDPDEEIDYDFYDPKYTAHLHDLQMQYKNKKLKQIILGIPKLLEPHEMEMLADDEYVLALQVQAIRDQDTLSDQNLSPDHEPIVATPTDTKHPTQPVRDGDSIVSAGGTYKLGFFSPGKSRNRYSGILYGTISVLTPVWVANRETPLSDSSGVPRLATPTDTINTAQFIRDGDTIVSAGGTYELGFFTPEKSRNRYLGIWYGKISVQTAVWVANRDTPLNDSSGVVKLTNQGLLVLLNRSGSIIWSSNTSAPARNPVAQLLDSGNLVVKEEGDNNMENSLWQSFEHRSNTLLPGMKVGRNIITGMEWHLTSCKSQDDPSRGNVTGALIPGGYPEYGALEDSKVKYRAGPWNGLGFSGLPRLKPNPIYTFEFVFNDKEIFYRENLVNNSTHWRVVLIQSCDFMLLLWMEQTQSWFLYSTANTDNCERYNLCGANGICSIDHSPVCDCLNGFVPKVPRDWKKTDWSSGCVRKTALNGSRDGFRKLRGLKMPETRKSWFNRSMNLEECKNTCLKNCSCTAYANLDIRDGGSVCLLWFNDLIDMRTFLQNEEDIFIRMAASELDNGDSAKVNSKSKVKKRIIVSSVLSTGILCIGLCLVLYVWKKKQQKNSNLQRRSNNKDLKEELELPFFNMDELACATNNFSVSNKLGEGDFGPVYKGTLTDGREIAVKRLSKNSRQGLDEFKNEVKHIVKLQHRNLVRLLGCCIEGDENILVYELLPNKSLDFYIFDETRSLLLDWSKRYNIINGIARGLLYLHQDSRLRIIHRDLKTSNILLDHEMNPKISDFGLARSFGENETEANTNKVAGTYGYISPEYANYGLYSLKSDVFSYKSRGFRHPDHHLNLIEHHGFAYQAWILFKQGRPLELAAGSKVETPYLSEVLRSIHVGLLCVQENPEDRPNMLYVVLMLGNEDELPHPKQPGFFTERDLVEASNSSRQSKLPSANVCSVSLLEAR